MTTEELFAFIKSQLSGCNGNVFMDKILEDLGIHIAKRPLFVPEKFKDWFIDRNVIYRNNPLAFLSKCGIADIDNGVFDKPQVNGINVTPMCNAMRERGVAVGDETILIDVVETYILNNDLMTEKELTEWNHVAIDYIAKLKNPSTKDFVVLFEKSKKMKSLNLPLEDLKREAEKSSKEWASVLKAIEKTPHGNEEVTELNESEIKKYVNKEN